MFWNNKPTRGGSTTAVARTTPKPQASKNFGLSLDIDSLKPTKPERSSDPYNTSGSFDRTKNWARVGKR
jgi:hypothetical protein